MYRHNCCLFAFLFLFFIVIVAFPWVLALLFLLRCEMPPLVAVDWKILLVNQAVRGCGRPKAGFAAVARAHNVLNVSKQHQIAVPHNTNAERVEQDPKTSGYPDDPSSC